MKPVLESAVNVLVPVSQVYTVVSRTEGNFLPGSSRGCEGHVYRIKLFFFVGQVSKEVDTWRERVLEMTNKHRGQ